MSSELRPLGQGSTYHIYWQRLVEDKLAETARLRSERQFREEKAARTIKAWMEGTLSPLSKMDHPSNPAEFWRCIYLLKREPEYRARLDEMAALSAEWRVLVTCWTELEDLLRSEWPNYDAPKCTARMRKLLGDKK